MLNLHAAVSHMCVYQILLRTCVHACACMWSFIFFPEAFGSVSDRVVPFAWFPRRFQTAPCDNKLINKCMVGWQSIMTVHK